MEASPLDEVYWAVIGDVVGSGSLPDRKVFQARFIEAVEAINEWIPCGSLVSRFAVTSGDGFQGLLTNPGRIYRLVLRLEELLPGTGFRAGVGRGAIETEIQETSLGMDGPAFREARNAVEDCRKRKALVVLRSAERLWDELLNSHLALLENLRHSWTPRQREVIAAVERHHTQESAARHLGVTGAAVSQVLGAANWPLYRQARDHLEKYLEGGLK